jgi:hypothetical protein
VQVVALEAATLKIPVTFKVATLEVAAEQGEEPDTITLY